MQTSHFGFLRSFPTDYLSQRSTTQELEGIKEKRGNMQQLKARIFLRGLCLLAE